MEIENRSIDDLIPYENNPRENDEAVEAVAASIAEFGFKVPIVIDSADVIVAGHTRLKAARALGLATVPCIVADDLSAEQIAAFRLADNKTAELADWNFDMLKAELDSISEIDMSQFGFDDLLEEIEEPEGAEIKEDDFDPENENVETRVKLGDVWELGNHRLICGDSTDPFIVTTLMDGEEADLVLTDPPYGMFLNADYSGMQGKSSIYDNGGNSYPAVIGDNEDFDRSLIDSVFDNFGYCKEIFLFGADYYAEIIPERKKGAWMVWDKRLSESADKMFGSCFELCWSKAKHKREIIRIKWAGIFGISEEDTKRRIHPTQKPIGLMGWFLQEYSAEESVVVDLYGGSGSVLIAAEELNRKCRMVELDLDYCDVIVARWEKFTGRKASKVSDG